MGAAGRKVARTVETTRTSGGGDAAPAATVHADRPRLGRPPLTERRKAATRLEIAREAVRLFADQGVTGTTADDIAAAVGISQRTLWRYTPSKELCVRPLLTYALDAATELMRSWPRDRPLAEAVATTRSPTSEEPAATDTDALRDLVRLTRTEPGLRTVWLQVHHDAEPVFAAVIAERTGHHPDDLEPRVQATVLNGALRVAVEEWAWSVHAGEATPAGAIARALGVAQGGLPG
ncbi:MULTISPECIES: TetR/AcrR family transcriptional regulator [Streptomyces]|uniref:TetR/AcrR family transcriptional regulator n=1 Tax=Streptomyces salyersiae TaxID=3075530 RepID=A0ABU2RRH4_9ACTN|nr:TetR/AcrR family transcriptional regulator [Streptomyces sp. DSM 41770]MDT0431132.1 TetR/AcrR family transcriptional regulator [Streptomyces sp. DSM 41770]